METKSMNKQLISWGIIFLIPLAILFIPTTETFTAEIRLFLVITIAAILCWAFEPLPLIVPSLMLPPVYILTGLGDPAQVYQPWSMPVPWLLIGGFIIAAVFEEAGLMKRVAYWCILRAGGSYKGILFGLLFSGIFVALMVPSNGGRVILYCALTYGICKALDLEPKSNTASAIMMCGFFSAIGIAFMFMTGSDTAIMAEAMLAEAGFGFTWLEYAKWNVPIFFIWGIIQIVVLLLVLKPDNEIHGKAYFEQEYKALGKMSISEKKMAIVFLFILVMLMWGKVAPQWIFIFASCLTFLPGIALANQDTVKKINVSMLIFVTATMSIGIVAGNVGAGKWLANALTPIMDQGSNMFVLFAVWLVAVLVNFLLTPLAAMASLTVPLIDLSVSLGMNPQGVIFAFIQGLNQIIFPYEYALVLLMYSFGMVSMKNLMKVFGARMVANLIFILLIAFPYWKLMGII